MDEMKDEDLNFHYNREERIKNAPELVQQYYSGEMKMIPKGLFKVIFANRASKLMFFAVLLLFAAVLMTNFLGSGDNVRLLSDCRMELRSFSFEDKVYVSLCIKPRKADKADKAKNVPVPVTAVFTAINAEKAEAASETVEGIYDGSEYYLRTTFQDYDIISVLGNITYKNDEVSVKSDVKKQ